LEKRAEQVLTGNEGGRRKKEVVGAGGKMAQKCMHI
jgi:hypothetical protein